MPGSLPPFCMMINPYLTIGETHKPTFRNDGQGLQGYFYCFLFGSDFRSDVQLRHLLKVPSMLRMMRNMIQHEYVFSPQIGDVDTSRDLMYICIWKSNHHFYWKGLSSSKATTIFNMVATTSRICLWKPIGPLHIYTPAMLLFKMWWSVWSAKENSLCSQSDLLPKTNMAMEGWSSGTCLPCFICSFCWVLSTQMSHFCPHQRFSDDVAGVSPAAMEEWTQWMRKKRAVLQLCGYQFGQRPNHDLIDSYIIIVI